MEKLILKDGSEYTLAVNGFNANENRVSLKLVTEEALENVLEAFSGSNTELMKVISEDGAAIAQAEGYTERGSIITREENAVISVNIVREQLDDDGTVIIPASLTENRGTVITFDMKKESIEGKVKQNRADIDYLLMMEDGGSI